jgi:hypothetical protein
VGDEGCDWAVASDGIGGRGSFVKGGGVAEIRDFSRELLNTDWGSSLSR